MRALYYPVGSRACTESLSSALASCHKIGARAHRRRIHTLEGVGLYHDQATQGILVGPSSSAAVYTSIQLAKCPEERRRAHCDRVAQLRRTVSVGDAVRRRARVRRQSADARAVVLLYPRRCVVSMQLQLKCHLHMLVKNQRLHVERRPRQQPISWQPQPTSTLSYVACRLLANIVLLRPIIVLHFASWPQPISCHRRNINVQRAPVASSFFDPRRP